MPRNRTPEDKLQAVKEYLSGKGSIVIIAEKYGVSDKPFRKWIAKYKTFGDAAFIRTGHNQSYSKEFKQMVINSYLTREGSFPELAIKYKIPSDDRYYPKLGFEV